jgi:uncharacterized YigZ family protein
MVAVSADRYPVPAARTRAHVSISRSRFICTIERVSTVEEAQAFIREMNAEFADATHNCWAYVVGAPGSTSRVGMSDAGEPHGTAGRPMLTVLLHSGVGDVAAVVTRYYGGTKLGTGGLVKAYGGAVQQALDAMPRAERVEYATLLVSIPYAAISVVRRLLPSHEAILDAESYGERAALRVRLPAPNVDALRVALMDATAGQCEVRAAE